jgi:hypothetical protein
MRFYSGYVSPVIVDRYESLDTIVEAAVEEPGRRVLVDLAAQTHDPFVKWIEDSGLLEMTSELGLSVRYWHVMDSGKDAVDLLKSLLDRFGSRLSYVLVLNEIRGEDFDILERSGQKERALALDATVISLKRLQDAAMRKIDAQSASFWAATNHDRKETGVLGLMERQRVKVWLKHAYGQLDTVTV